MLCGMLIVEVNGIQQHKVTAVTDARHLCDNESNIQVQLGAFRSNQRTQLYWLRISIDCDIVECKFRFQFLVFYFYVDQ